MEPTPEITKPRIYVACLASHNEGIPHGAWMDATRGREGLFEDIERILRASPAHGAEEYAILEHEGFCGLTIEADADPNDVSIMADFVVRQGAFGVAVANHCSGDVDVATGKIMDDYIGAYPCLADYLRGYAEREVEIPGMVEDYIGWKEMADDAARQGLFEEVVTEDGVAHVFRGWAHWEHKY